MNRKQISPKKWTAEETDELKWFYFNGGDKALPPMRIFAENHKRTLASVWAKVRRSVLQNKTNT